MDSRRAKVAVFSLETETTKNIGDPAYRWGNYLLKKVFLVCGLEIKQNDYINTKGDPIFSRIATHIENEYIQGNENKLKYGKSAEVIRKDRTW